MMTISGWPANMENKMPPMVCPMMASMTPILPWVLCRFSTPNAIAGRMQAKYKNIVAEMVL